MSVHVLACRGQRAAEDEASVRDARNDLQQRELVRNPRVSVSKVC